MAQTMDHNTTGTVYLLHFSEHYKHAGHYIGYTDNLDERLARHKAGNGARLIQVITEAGLTFVLARTWQGGHILERKLKQHGATRICPICNPETAMNRMAQKV